MNMERTERRDNLLLHVWLVKLQSLTKTNANHTHCSDRSIWMESLLRGPSRHVKNQETRQEAKQVLHLVMLFMSAAWYWLSRNFSIQRDRSRSLWKIEHQFL